MDVTEAQFDAANQRAETTQAGFPPAIKVRYDRRSARVVITLASGLELAFSPRRAQGLERASADDLLEAEISPSGLGVRFPRIDADLYLPALLQGFLGSKSWIAAELGKRGGAVSSVAKADAARRNGKLGGRPRRVKQA